MKFNRFILPLAAAALLTAGCEDQIMQWQESDPTITEDDIPLTDEENLALYKTIKEYAQEYTPNITIGLGLGAAEYIESPEYKALADQHFQMFTTGNAMKHSSVVKATGDLDFTTIDQFMALVPSDVKVYGHNFIWHTQQKQQYLKGLIAPEVKIEVGSGEVCENIITNYSFANGTSGWTGLWGKYTYEVTSPGRDDDACLHFTISPECVNMWDAQLFWALSTPLEDGVTYAYEFYIRSDAGLQAQVIGQNESYSGIYKDTFTPGTDWTYCTGEFTYNAASDPADIIRIGIQFGGEPGSQLWVDDFKFGKKVETPQDPMINIVGDAGTFEDGDASAFGCWGNNNPTKSVSAEGEGFNSNYSMVLTNPEDGGEYQEWKAQCAYDLSDYLDMTKTYMVQFYVRSDAPGTIQVQYQNGSTYGSQGGYARFETSTDWILVETEFTPEYEDVNRILMNFGAFATTYYVDDFKFGEKLPDPESAPKMEKASSITYIYKTAEEKKAILLNAMETWIKGMAEHLPTITSWDVINEPILDGGIGWRGIDNRFGGTDDNGVADSEPVEFEGLELNWASDHFYWGYYIGTEYAVKAFEYARKYCPAGSRLYVNDYNLENSPEKLASLIEFVNYIESQGQTVDGIGTQMHVSTSVTKEQVDQMFKTIAATGKFCRVTELDVTVGTATPSADQLLAQAETYKMIVESYMENIPAAQQDGITFWTLSDNPDEHTYWLSGDAPNLFDANYGRKLAYKYVCDALAGRDLSEDFVGSQWKEIAEPVTEEE